MEIVKDFFGALGGRLRSHFIGSILLSMLAFNWDSVLFLLMGGNSVWMKIAYIEEHWQLAWPIVIGILIGLLNPWMIVGGAYLAKIPSEKLHSLQDQTKHTRAMQLLENDAIENDKKAELAKSTDDALKSIDDEDIRDSLKDETLPTKDADSKKAELSAKMYKNDRKHWHVKLYNRGPSSAYNVRIELADDNAFLNNAALDEVLPLRELEEGHSVELRASVNLSSPRKEDIKIVWDDKTSTNKTKTVTLTL